MKKVLITGAFGYLGARLSKHLAEKGYNVTAFGSYEPSNYIEWISLMDEIIIGDVRDESAISRLADKNFDVVIHLISLDHYKSENNPNFVSSINVMPTWILLDKFTKNGLKKFIYFSTIHVYGNLPREIITENQTPEPINVYGLTHFLSENICNYFNDKTETECINIRLSNSYGSPIFKENNCWWLVINDLCRTAFEKHKIKLLSDGSPQRDFIHGDDIVAAIDILINYNCKNGNNIFHISSGQTLTILELAHLVKDVYFKKWKKEIDIYFPDNSVSEYPDKFKKLEKYVINNRRIKNLGFQQKTSLESGINEIFEYFGS